MGCKIRSLWRSELWCKQKGTQLFVGKSNQIFLLQIVARRQHYLVWT